MQVRAKLMAKGIESDFQEADGKIKITVRHLAKVPGVSPGATDGWSVRNIATSIVVVWLHWQVLQVLGGRALEDKVSKALTKHGVIFTLQVRAATPTRTDRELRPFKYFGCIVGHWHRDSVCSLSEQHAGGQCQRGFLGCHFHKVLFLLVFELIAKIQKCLN